MELNDNSYSDWLKEMLKTVKPESPKKLFKVYPISDYKCCQNPVRLTSNDGNRTQKCANCNWIKTYGGWFN